ncbi:Retinol dehydrogenase 14 [Halotydeus destructor]|nr:Retinol dehydrogenase 14 [Halotydeus destructor]
MEETTVYAELALVSVAAGVVILRIYSSRAWGKCKSNRKLNGKTVVITGGNSGIGKATAIELVKRGARVIIGCRNEKEAMHVVEKISSKGYEGDIKFKHLDLASFASVRKFAEDLNSSEENLDILINNAAVYSCPYGLTQDGFETQFQVNHLSHALLSCLLLPKLNDKATHEDPSRIINVTSTHYVKGKIRECDFKPRVITEKMYDKRTAYNNSKLAANCFSKDLSRRLGEKSLPINVYSASPGLVLTNLGRHVRMQWWKLIFFLPVAAIFVRTPYQGCQTILHCALSPKLNKSSGKLFRNCKETQPYGILTESSTMKNVYDLTMKSIAKGLENIKTLL